MEYQNRGALVDPREKRVAGIIPYTIRNPDGDWTKWLPEGEKQFGKVDSMACVSFSLINCIETQEYFLTGKKVNYSDRWLAKISGTTKQGNYLISVADAVNQYGLVREESWPKPDNYTWEEFYADPEPTKRKELFADGQKWLKTHKFEYEWLTTNRDVILKHLKQCPLQILLPGHAVENFYTYTEAVNYLDSYEPFLKQTMRSTLTDVFKPYLTIMDLQLINDNGTIYLVGDKGKLGFADMESLNMIKSLSSKEIPNASTTGIPQLRVMKKGFTID